MHIDGLNLLITQSNLLSDLPCFFTYCQIALFNVYRTLIHNNQHENEKRQMIFRSLPRPTIVNGTLFGPINRSMIGNSVFTFSTSHNNIYIYI